MNKFLLLTRILLKNGESALSLGYKKKSRVPAVLLPFLLLLAMLPFSFMIGYLVMNLYDSLLPVQQEGTILALGFVAISMMIFLFGIFYVINTFYFANDIETLLPMPLTSAQIMGAKFTTVVLYEYLVEAIIFMPLVIAYGIKSGSGILFYLYSIMIFLAIPILPLILASIIVMVIMRFTNLAKNKDRMRVIGGMIAVVLAVGGNFLFQYYSRRSMSAEQLQELFLQKNSLIHLVSSLFPTSRFPAEALVHSTNLQGLANLAIFMGISLITLIIFLFLAEAIYLKGVIGISETHSKRKAYSQEELASLTKESSPLTALLLKELRFLFRTPAYFMNCILSNLLLPVVMVIAFILNSGELSKLPDLLLRFLEGKTGFVQSIVFLFSVFLGSANNIAATAISREGKNFYVNKYLPVPYLTHIWAKLLSGVIISLIPIILVIAALIVLIHPSVLFILLSSMTAVLGILFASLVGVLIDLKYPKLDWANEQRAVKSNINGLLSLLLNSLIAGLTVFMMFRLDVPAWTGYIVLLGLTLVYNLILIWILAAKGEKWFGQIEA